MSGCQSNIIFEKCKRVINSCQSVYEMKCAYRYLSHARTVLPRIDHATLMGVFHVKAQIFKIKQSTIHQWHSELVEGELK